MTESHLDVTEELKALFGHLSNVCGGSESVSEFGTWFLMNASWEARNADPLLVELEYGIRLAIHEFEDAPQQPRGGSEFVARIECEVTALGLPIPTLTTSNMG